jgi:hypothetical protein
VEDQPERRLLRVVQVEDLAQQDRAELGERRADGRRAALAAEGEELDGVRRGRPVVAGVLHARLDTSVVLARPRHPGQVALDVGQEHGHTGVRQLPRQRLQRLRLAGAGRAGHEAVPVEHRERDPHPRVRIDLPVDDDGAQFESAALDRVTGRDALRRSLIRVVCHDVGA